MTKKIEAFEVYCDGCGRGFGEFASDGHPDFYRSAEEAVDAATSGFEWDSWKHSGDKVLCNVCADKEEEEE